MSKLTKSAKAQKSNIKAYASGFYFLGLACIEAAREEGLKEYYNLAGVPAVNASNKAKKAWLDEKISPAFGQLFNGRKWVGAVLQTKKEKSFSFIESEDIASNCKNINGLQVEYGKSTGKEGALRSAFLFIECQKLVDIVLQDNGAAGKVFKVDEKTGKRARKKVTYKKYVTLRPIDKSGKELYTLEDFIDVFFRVLGIPQAIAAEIADRAQLRAAKTIAAANQAAAVAAAAAAKANADAVKADEKAKAKADAAKATQAKQGMTAAQAQKIVQADAERKAAEQAEKNEGESMKAGENVRKKANTKTKASQQVTTK